MQTVRKNPIRRTALKVMILIIALQDNGMGAATPALAIIGKAFPEAGYQLISMITTLPALMLAIMPIFYPAITNVLRKKKVLLIASIFFMVGGIGPAIINGSIYSVLFFRLLLGMACGTFIPLASDLVVDFFESSERDSMLGLASAATGLGGVSFQTLGGWLAAFHWSYCFFAYLIAGILLLIPIIFLPEPKRTKGNAQQKLAENGEKVKIPAGVWIISLFLCLYWTTAYIIITNTSAVLLLEGIAVQAQIGLIFSCMTAGTVASSVLLGVLIDKIGFVILPVSTLFGAASLFIAHQAQTIPAFIIALFLLGFGTGIMTPGSVAKNTSLVPYEGGTKAVSITYLLMGIGSFISPIIFNNLGMDARKQMEFGSIIFMVLFVLLAFANWKIKPQTKTTV